MKSLSSKRARACALPQRVKREVWERDGGACVWCGLPGNPEAHFIPRSKGGLGIPENVLTLCRECHDQFDNGMSWKRARMRLFFEDYLKSKYPDWNELKLIYHKEGL